MESKESIRNGAIIIAITGALAVVLGAFGAHGLKAQLSVDQLASYNTAVKYHFIHVLIMAVLYFSSGRSRVVSISFYLFFIGIILFSGSIYLLATRDLTGMNNSILGPITPIGGVFFILGWLNLIRLKT